MGLTTRSLHCDVKSRAPPPSTKQTKKVFPILKPDYIDT